MKKEWIIIAMATLVVMGCSGVSVNQDYDPSINLHLLRTYDWETQIQQKTGDPRIDNPLRDTRIRAAVDRLLAKKGIIKSVDNNPAFFVRYQNTLRRRIESNGHSRGIGFGVGSYGRHGGIAVGTGNRVRDYDESSMVIDFLAPASKSLLWRGNGTQRFKEYDDPQKADRDIYLLMENILKQFPPNHND